MGGIRGWKEWEEATQTRSHGSMWECGGVENLGGWGRRRQAKTDHKKTQSKRQSWTNGFRAGCW